MTTKRDQRQKEKKGQDSKRVREVKRADFRNRIAELSVTFGSESHIF